MSDNHFEIMTGLSILRHYDDTGGDVSMSNDRVLFAGPEDGTVLESISKQDRAKLRSLGWEYDADIGRWGWS